MKVFFRNDKLFKGKFQADTRVFVIDYARKLASEILIHAEKLNGIVFERKKCVTETGRDINGFRNAAAKLANAVLLIGRGIAAKVDDVIEPSAL